MRNCLVGKKKKTTMAADSNYRSDTDKNKDKNKSKQIAHLDNVASQRYIEKLVFEGRDLPDPYSIDKSKWENAVTKWPDVSYPDIYNYLINYPGTYTSESLKAYKSLEGYNYYNSGHVQEVFYCAIDEDLPVCAVKAKVAPSQRANDKPHEPWLYLDKTRGYVVCAHCTCKAGLGEACSHVAALLFKMMMATLWGLNRESKTSVSCTWNQFYRKKITHQPVSQMTLANLKPGQEIKRKQRLEDETAMLTVDENEALESLKRLCPTACFLTKDDSDTDTGSEDEDTPPLLDRIHGQPEKNLSAQELAVKCDEFLKDFSVTPQQAQNLETMTRGQHNSAIWMRQRKGRITATVAHDILTLRTSTSKKALLSKIMQYKCTDLSNVAAIAFGRKSENSAKSLYIKQMVQHEKFSLRECGLFVETAFPLFAATPDGVRSCKCHGEGLLEIKSTYKHRDSELTDIRDESFFLDSGLILKKSHRYYSQVQFQMFVCGKTFCDFVVYSNKGIVCQTIYFDMDFVRNMIEKCKTFALDDLIPEIIIQKFKV